MRVSHQISSSPSIKTKRETYGHAFRRRSRIFFPRRRRRLRPLHISEAVWPTLSLLLFMKTTRASFGSAPWEGLIALIDVQGKTRCPRDRVSTTRYFPFSKTVQAFSSAAPFIRDLNG